jgi:hypothetical protein
VLEKKTGFDPQECIIFFAGQMMINQWMDWGLGNMDRYNLLYRSLHPSDQGHIQWFFCSRKVDRNQKNRTPSSVVS